MTFEVKTMRHINRKTYPICDNCFAAVELGYFFPDNKNPTAHLCGVCFTEAWEGDVPSVEDRRL